MRRGVLRSSSHHFRSALNPCMWCGRPTRTPEKCAGCRDKHFAGWLKRWRQGARLWAMEVICDPKTRFVDFETTGLNLPRQAIELCILNHRGEVLFLRRFRPELPIDPNAQAKHGLTMEMLAQERSFAGLWPEIRELLSGARVVAYHAAFDRAVLQDELTRMGYSLAQACDAVAASRWECAMEAYAAYLGAYQRRMGWWSPRLPASVHQARGDCEALHTMLLGMLKTSDPRDADEEACDGL